MSFHTPVLLIVFNRPETTFRVFDAIRNVRPSRLFIAADAPRIDHPLDDQLCKKTREIVTTVDWPCEVFTLFRVSNKGCGLNVSEAINWFFEHNEEGIILEDDCVPHPDFFYFATAMLSFYKDDKRIISINGSNLGFKPVEVCSYTYSRFMNMWGWATWQDRALKIDYNVEQWRIEKRPNYWLYKNLRQNLFDLDLNWYRLWKDKFNKVTENRNYTWDWQWVFHQIANKQLSIVPAVNLVTNIGFNSDATHTYEENNPASNIQASSLKFPLLHPKNMKPDFVYEEKYVKWVWCYYKRLPFIFYIKRFISNLIRK